jgi:hypothetical protein
MGLREVAASSGISVECSPAPCQVFGRAAHLAIFALERGGVPEMALISTVSPWLAAKISR